MGFLIRVRVSVPVSWARLYARSWPGRIWRALSSILLRYCFEIMSEEFSLSYELDTALSPNTLKAEAAAISATHHRGHTCSDSLDGY